MQTRRLLSLATLALTALGALASGCETGWDVEATIVTKDAPDKQRALHVYTVNAETIDVTAFTRGDASIRYEPQSQSRPIPADKVDVSLHYFGCHRGSFAMVAWSPSSSIVVGIFGLDPMLPFQPQAGDYVAFSDVRHPYCGVETNPEHIELVLDGQAYP